jgi:hypothetical protein
MSFKLKIISQCAKCPWKKSTNPNEIPDGYSIELHKGLISTISTDPIQSILKPTANMACHHSNCSDEMYCIGWLNNQLGNGNNIGLRLRMRDCENLSKIKVIGEQHLTFKDTVPNK